jgi:hypothetical protein
MFEQMGPEERFENFSAESSVLNLLACQVTLCEIKRCQPEMSYQTVMERKHMFYQMLPVGLYINIR